jgi:hypothetical protein
MRNIRTIVLVAGLVAGPWAVEVLHSQLNDPYQGIPAGYDFPADQSTLLRFRDTNDVAGMRRHAWMVFAGFTQPAATGEALWETWYTGVATFAPGERAKNQPRRIQHLFNAPRQLQTASNLFALGNSLLSFTLFNLPAYNFIESNHLYRRAELDRLRKALPADTPVAQRQITPFPPDSVALKTIWWIVKKDQRTCLPVWDGIPPGPNGQPGNPNGEYFYTQFGRWVLVDPLSHSIKPEESARTTCLGHTVRAHVVPLEKFYSFPLDQTALNSINSEIGNVIPPLVNPLGLKPSVGDYAVLVAMHCTTKEIPDWVWSTFWWHDRPEAGRFAADRPPAVTGVWRNYLMNVAYSTTTPLEPDSSPHIAFNPWIEAELTDGVQSNCMACHARSVWCPNSSDRFTVRRGEPDPNDPLFKNGIQLDFIWSIAIEPQ